MKNLQKNSQEIPKCTQEIYPRHLRNTQKGEIVSIPLAKKCLLWHQWFVPYSVLCSDVVTVNKEKKHNAALNDHVDWNRYSAETCIPPSPVLFFWCVIWCVCDVLFDAHQMFIFPSPDGGTCLFLRELLGDRREGRGLTVSQSQKILK